MPTFTARRPEDLLALVPVVIGFEPTESIVMLTFGGRRPFHARIDLPPPEEVTECAERLLAPARRHAVQAVALVLFSAEPERVPASARELRDRFTAAGVRVVDVLHVREGRWFRPLSDSAPVDGVPYDVAGHPFRAEAVLQGRVISGSRQDLVDRLRPDPAAVAQVAEALGDLWDCVPHELRDTVESAPTTESARALMDTVRPDGPSLHAMLQGHVAAGTVPTAGEVAQILLAVHNPAIRDHAWFGMRRTEAVHHVRLWTDLVRRAPEGLVAGAAGVLAFAAWMSGDGALAWCAVDRCFEDEPEHSLGRLVSEALEAAIPPLEDWDDAFPHGLAG